MSIKKQGEMSNELALGIRSQIVELKGWIIDFEGWITSLEGIEQKEVTQELRTEILHPISNFVDDLEAFEEGGEYEALDKEEG